jgi:transcriptional antiterminator NusG
MDIQEPEEQRLEEEPMEPAESVSEPSDEPVLNDADASTPDEEPASDIQSSDETKADSTEEVVEEETPPDTPVAEEPKETPEDVVEQDDEPVAVEATGDESEVAPAEEEAEPELEADDDPSAWFVVHCYSGYENKVRHNLEQRIETMGMKDMIFDVVVPTQEEIEVRDGKRRTVERHIFPGYVLVNMILTEESWYVVRNTPGVTGFVGMGNNPTPLRPEEVAQIVKRMEADAPTVKVTFKVGERVRIIDGPFNDFRGVVSEIDMERTKVRVMVSFFGRETPVELDFLQVEKA